MAALPCYARTMGLLLFFLIACLSSACSRATPQEVLLEKAFVALQKNDYENFKKLTITLADFELKRTKGGPFAKSQSYAGQVLKPEQVQAQRDQFKRATAGGPGCIDFKASKFIGIDTADQVTREPLLTGDPITCTVYSLKIKTTGAVADTKSLDPLFVVTSWGDQCRILELRFKK